jgi:putative oxidoreductase
MAEVTITRATPGLPIATITRVQGVSTRVSDVTIGVTRIVIGFLFACHGFQKLFGAFGKAPAPIGAWPSWWAGVIELVAGGLIMVGLFTRPAAVLCSGTMAYAYFMVHQSHGLLPLQNKGELAAVYSWVFLLIAFIGPGALAIDAVRRRRAQAAQQ